MTALLLAAGADPDDNESVYHAVEAPDTRCLRLLLDAGATVARTNALPNALGRGAPETVRLLLEQLPAGHHERRWALQWAVGAGESPEVVRLLVEHGADLEALRRERGPDALRARGPDGTARPRRAAGPAGSRAPGRARRRADRRRVRRRSRGGRAARGRRPGVAGARPPTAYAGALAQAAGDARPETVRILLDLGVPVDSRGELGGTALHHAAWIGDAGLVAALIARGAGLERLDTQFGMTPLGWAVHGASNATAPGDHVAVAETLARAGARVPAGLADGADGDLADWLAAHAAPAPAGGPATDGGAEPTPAAAPATPGGAQPAAGAPATPGGEPDYGELEWRTPGRLPPPAGHVARGRLAPGGRRRGGADRAGVERRERRRLQPRAGRAGRAAGLARRAGAVAARPAHRAAGPARRGWSPPAPWPSAGRWSWALIWARSRDRG